MANRRKPDEEKMKKKLQFQVTEQMYREVEQMAEETKTPYAEMLREDLQKRIDKWKAKRG